MVRLEVSEFTIKTLKSRFRTFLHKTKILHFSSEIALGEKLALLLILWILITFQLKPKIMSTSKKSVSLEDVEVDQEDKHQQDQAIT